MSLKNTKVITGVIRMNYTNLFPQKTVNGEQKYSLSIIIAKTEIDTLEKIKSAIEEAKLSGVALWGGKIPENLKLPLRDGDREKPDQPEYTGHWFLNAASKKAPGLVDINVNAITNPDEIYSGCFGRVSICAYPYCYRQGNSVINGVGFRLLNVQKLYDGEPLDKRPTPQEDFGEAQDGLLW